MEGNAVEMSDADETSDTDETSDSEMDVSVDQETGQSVRSSIEILEEKVRTEFPNLSWDKLCLTTSKVSLGLQGRPHQGSLGNWSTQPWHS